MRLEYIIPILCLLVVVLISGCVGQTSQPPIPKCEPNWQCGDWNPCTRTGKTTGVQSRTCTDLNSCNNTIGKPAESQTCTLPVITTKEPSEMLLELTDFPSTGNWTLRNREERIKSDVDKEGLNLGWIKGNQATFTKIGGEQIWGIPIDVSKVDHAISIYPIENISKVLTIPKQSTENMTINELSKPNIGDDSRAYRIDTKDESGTESRGYVIEFIKMDVYEALSLTGTVTDYELLKDLAKKAESKIS
jgi:hypothetical protein